MWIFNEKNYLNFFILFTVVDQGWTKKFGKKFGSLRDLFYEGVENNQIATVSRTIQWKNCKIPNDNIETITSQSNDRYLYTVPDDEEPSLNQAPEVSDYMKAYMYI